MPDRCWAGSRTRSLFDLKRVSLAPPSRSLLLRERHVEPNASACGRPDVHLLSWAGGGREDVPSTQYILLPFTLSHTRSLVAMKGKEGEKRASFQEMIKTGIDVWVRPRPDHQELLAWFGLLPLLPQN